MAKGKAKTLKSYLSGHMKGSAWLDPFIIGIVVFALMIGLTALSAVGSQTTSQVAAQMHNVTYSASITAMGNNMFLNTPDIIVCVLYFLLIVASFISASYEGANPAITLFLGLFFLLIAEVVSFGLSNVAHAYMAQTALLNITPHYPLTYYIMNYLPVLNGIFIIADIIFVVSKRETVSLAGFGGGGQGGVVTQ